MTHEQLLRIYWATNPEMLVSMQTYAGIQTGKIHSVNTRGFTAFYLQNDNGSVFQSADAIKPHLKPLSSITDEDAIAVAKMAFNLKADSWEFDITHRDPVTQVGCSLKLPNGKYEKQFICISELGVVGNFAQGQVTDIYNHHQITDYLRSKSYNLDFEPLNFIAI